MVHIRPVVKQATYMVGDALGIGFGSSTWTQDNEIAEAEHGNWSMRVTLSSNFRKAANLAMRLNSMMSKGILKKGREIWVFTDNTTAEKTYYKGSSSSAFAPDGPGTKKA